MYSICDQPQKKKKNSNNKNKKHALSFRVYNKTNMDHLPIGYVKIWSSLEANIPLGSVSWDIHLQARPYFNVSHRQMVHICLVLTGRIN